MKKIFYKILLTLGIISGVTGTAHAIGVFNSAQLAPSPSNGNCLSTNGAINSWASSCGGTSVGPINTLQASNGSGGFIATGTPQLTVGYLLATSTTATSTFMGALSVGTSTSFTNNGVALNTFIDTCGNLILNQTNVAGTLDCQIDPLNPSLSIPLGNIYIGDKHYIRFMGALGYQQGSIFYNFYHDNNQGELQINSSNSFSFNGGLGGLHAGTIQMGSSNSTYETINFQYNGTADNSIATINIANGGSGYVAGDTLTVSGGTAGATGNTFVLTSGNLTGTVITSIPWTTDQLLNGKGLSYSNANGVALTGGTGSGATVNITVWSSRPSKKVTYTGNYWSGGQALAGVISNIADFSDGCATTCTGLQQMKWYDNDPSFGSNTLNPAVGREIGKLSTKGFTASTFVASSTSVASSLPYASTTAISSSNLTSGNCVQASTGGLLTTTGSACGAGGGGGGGNSKWATTTNLFGIYPNGGTNIGVVIGRTATTTNSLLETNGTTTASVFVSTTTLATNTFAGFISSPKFTDQQFLYSNAGVLTTNNQLSLVGGGSVLQLSGNVSVMNGADFAQSSLTNVGTLGLTLGQGWLYSNGGSGATVFSSTSPTINYLTATSTTATSTFAGDTIIGPSTGASQFVVDYSGNVGVGTSTPYAPFSVQGSGGTTDIMAVATSTGAPVSGVDKDGHSFTSGPTPVLSSCGTGSPTVTGDDQTGTITTGTAATSCTMTFAKAYINTPVCNFNDNSSTIPGDISSISTTAVTFALGTGLSGGNLFYSCRYHK